MDPLSGSGQGDKLAGVSWPKVDLTQVDFKAEYVSFVHELVLVLVPFFSSLSLTSPRLTLHRLAYHRAAYSLSTQVY